MDDRLRIAAHAGGSEGIEKRRLRIGFVPLADCAPLVFAKERGHFRRHGLEVELSREVSWATVRDKVATGALDAAQMLAPMPFASALGLGGLELPICTGLSLDLDGNAITVSEALYRRLADADPDALIGRPLHATALRAVIEAGPRGGPAAAALRHRLPLFDPRPRAALLARLGGHRSGARRLAARRRSAVHGPAPRGRAPRRLLRRRALERARGRAPQRAHARHQTRDLEPLAGEGARRVGGMARPPPGHPPRDVARAARGGRLRR